MTAIERERILWRHPGSAFRLLQPVGHAGEGVRGGERDERRVGDKLPCSAKVKTLLEDSGRSCEIPATKVGEAEIEQSSIQRLRMIGFFSDPHCDLTVRDGLVGPAKLG